MELAVFQELTEQIALECFHLTDSQKEEKIIQMIDLHHFIECYNGNLNIVNCINHSVNIVEDSCSRKGILFYDLKHSSDLEFKELKNFRASQNLEELWFVFVEEDSNVKSGQYSDFIKEKDVEYYCDRFFVFQFFQSVINELK